MHNEQYINTCMLHDVFGTTRETSLQQHQLWRALNQINYREYTSEPLELYKPNGSIAV